MEAVAEKKKQKPKKKHTVPDRIVQSPTQAEDVANSSNLSDLVHCPDQNNVESETNKVANSVECEEEGEDAFKSLTEGNTTVEGPKETPCEEQHAENSMIVNEQNTHSDNQNMCWVQNGSTSSAPPESMEDQQENAQDCSEKQLDFEKYLNLNKQLVQTLDSLNSIPAQVAGCSKEMLAVAVQNYTALQNCLINPYTEQQLNALYYNTELEVLDEFMGTFIENELRSQQLKKHYLYELLVQYLTVREKITGTNIEIDDLRKEYHNLQLTIWTQDVSTVGGRATCQDGKVVQTVQEYNRSIFHRSVFQSLVRILDKIQKSVYDKYVLFSYRADNLKMQIEAYVDGVMENVIRASHISDRVGVMLVMDNSDRIQSYANELRLSISVLFAFQRKLIKEPMFVKDSRDWLTKLIAVLLRMANYQDHLFLLHHVLRCPAGVSTWGASFIQIPLYLPIDVPFGCYEINHLLSILSVMLCPIKERTAFLKDIAHSNNNTSETSWVVVDSDGEEDEESGTSLRENDLVALLNQLPFGDMFRSVLLISRSDDKDKYNLDLLTEQHMLRYLAFSSVFLRIVRQGLDTYCLPKYNQFCKRLSRVIRHIVQYATDQWEILLKRGDFTDKALMQRLQVEYDSFFLRAIYHLYSSQKLFVWQFLAVVPYNMITTQTLWKIYYFLHLPDDKAEDLVKLESTPVNYKELVSQSDLRRQFEEKLPELGAAEVYYLLNTFANMALARSETDLDFIQFCTMDILQVGFVSQTTQETCWKSSRTLLTHLCSKFPCFLSSILKTVYDNLDQIGSLALSLYEDIPLQIWSLDDVDFIYIERLLLNYPITSDHSKLARMILSRLNWESISYEKHCQTALMVLRAVDQEPLYINWGWQTILRLKLHISDRLFDDLRKVDELERCDILLKGIRENQPLASFVAVLMTTWGHLVPLVCSNGLDQLAVLQSHQKHEAVLFALYQILPIFIKHQECIINSSKFQDIIVNMLNADRGYISYAKSFLITQNTILEQFGNMVEAQIANYGIYNLPSPRLLVRLWMNSLISIPNWNKDSGILYLVDIIIRSAFLYPEALQVVYESFRDLCTASTPQESGSIMSKLRWSSSNNKNGYTLLPISLAQYPWLSYVFLDIEHQEKEYRTGLWPELLKELAGQKGKVNVDSAIKNVTGNLKLTAFSSSYLCLYRWAQQGMDTSADHPILPLIWQKFFILYLARLTESHSLTVTCVGERFFDGLINFAFLKKIKKRLQEIIDHYKTKVETSTEDNSSDNVQVELNKLKYQVFQAFLLWLEEPRLQSGNLLLQSLPAQYEPNLLALIIQQNDQTPWYQYIDHNRIVQDQMTAIKNWRMANFREKSKLNQPLINPGRNIESDDPVERILRRLASYDAVQSPPKIQRSPVELTKIELCGTEELLKSLEPNFKILVDFAHSHFLNVSNHKALDCTFRELLPQLFTSVTKNVKKNVPCRGRNDTVLCSGPAVISLVYQEAKRNERIDHEIQINRQAYESLLEKSLQPPPSTLCKASVSLQNCVRILQEEIKVHPATSELGVELFYRILSYLHDEVVSYLPAKTLLASCLEKLGQSHISGVENEMPRLLRLILQEPKLGAYLAPYFSPTNCGNSNMLFMYSTIIKEVPTKYEVAYALMSKFDVNDWLNHKTPNLSQRTKIIENLIQALSGLGFDPPVDSLALHSLYIKHLVTVFEYQFPEHYGEILIHLLKASNGTTESSLVSESVWIAIINSLSKPTKLSLKSPLKDQLREYAQLQKTLVYQDLLDTCKMFAQHFTQDRLSYGLYGLYPKCRMYIDVFALLLEMAGHALIVSMLNTHQGILGEKLCEKIWPYIRDMFTPWLVPYSKNVLKEDLAVWIQQLTDDRTILLPWIPADQDLATKLLNSFCQCINFILDTLPAALNILSYLFQWYVTSYAHKSVKEHILTPVHKAFVTFPWNKFWPSQMDLEFMLRVVDQYLPECHSFLGHVFLLVPWANWINAYNGAPPQIKCRTYSIFLSLLVKLTIEPSVRRTNSEKARSILIQAENFDWNNLDPTGFQHIMDWVVMSCDSSVIFKTDILDLDYRLLSVLKLASGYNKVLTGINPDVRTKRQIFVKSHIKLLSVFVGRNKGKIYNQKENEIGCVITEYLNDLDTVVTTTEELEVLLKEIFSVINIPDISETALKIAVRWIESKTYGYTVKVLLKTLGTCVVNCKHLAVLYEATLTSYFNISVLENNIEDPTWSEASQLIHFCALKPSDFEQALLEEGSVLTLNAILLQKANKNVHNDTLLNVCISWLEKIKPRDSIEAKIPLIWFTVINLALRSDVKSEAEVANQLYRFSQILIQFAENSGSGLWGRGLLNVIGFSKTNSVSLNFRFLCRAIAGYILAQLPDTKALPKKIRREANASGAIGTPGGNSECAKILLEMDFGQSQGKIKESAQFSLIKIQDPENSLHNGNEFLMTLIKLFYRDAFLNSVNE